MPVCLSLFHGRQFAAGSRVPGGYLCACRSPLQAGIYLGHPFPRESKVNVRRASFFGLVCKVPLSFCFFGGWGEPDLTWVRVG